MEIFYKHKKADDEKEKDPFDLKAKKFLVIDDMAEFRAALGSILRSFGVLFIDHAKTGESAIDMLEHNTYDVILCDYNLGGERMDGQQVLEEIKHRDLISISTIFIMVSAENQSEMVMGVVEYYPDDYLIKPFGKDQFQSRIEKALKKKKNFELIEATIKRKEFNQAIELCEEQITKDPPNLFEYLKLKGELYLKIGNYNQAKTLYEEILSIREIPWAKIGLGRVFFYQEKYTEARQIFTSLIQENRMNIIAYDWLTKTLLKLNASQEALNILKKAITLSPKSVNRQNILGETAYQNKENELAERAFKNAIEIGKYSYKKTPVVYTGLAKVLLKKGEPEEALSVLKEIKYTFRDSPEADFLAAAMKGVTYKAMNRKEEAQKDFQEASELFKTSGKKIAKETLLDLARSCLEVGEKETALLLFKDLIRNNHDDEDLHQQIQEIFSEANLLEEGKRLIESIREEIIQVNNQGVRLVEAGNFTEAITCFEEAVKVLPKNKIIIANMIQTMLVAIQFERGDEPLFLKAKEYLDLLKDIDPEYKKIPMLLEKYELLSQAKEQKRKSQSVN